MAIAIKVMAMAMAMAEIIKTTSVDKQ